MSKEEHEDMGKSGLGKRQNKRSVYEHHIDICYLTNFQKLIVRVECISNEVRGKILKNKGLRKDGSRRVEDRIGY